MATEKKLQKTPKFICEKCDYTSSKQNEYDRHLVTNKHKRLHRLPEKTPTTQTKTFNCICGKKYNHHTSLAKHKRTCIILHPSSANSYDDTVNCEEHKHDMPINQNIVITPEMFMKFLNDRAVVINNIKQRIDHKF